MKTTLLLFSLLLLSACSEGTRSITKEIKLPDNLKDCSVDRIDESGMPTLFVTRCPNSSTSTTASGKHPVTTTLIEDAEETRRDIESLQEELKLKQLKLQALEKLSEEEKRALGL